jgi:hypothetical protein
MDRDTSHIFMFTKDGMKNMESVPVMPCQSRENGMDTNQYLPIETESLIIGSVVNCDLYLQIP